ncbi:MFS transporter [Flexivirga sp. ID2601S]|uniref:MFS transporter n=1 Tax=Flexivirga aerilata TaxID=1656889 RepID=A0A849AFZ3_9MICO|nr:MFS transporter [Flexivirga aerilata]
MLDSTIVNVAVPDIRADLHTGSSTVELIMAGYQAAFAAVLLVGGRLGDVHGRRRLFLLGMAGFVLASVACGLAGTGSQLVAARFAQGAFSGLMFPQVLAILKVSTPPAQRPKVFGIYGATVGLSTVLGPVLGGVLIDPLDAGWRSVFWVNVPIGLAALAAGRVLLPNTPPQRGRPVDLFSAALLASALLAVLFPLTFGRENGWPISGFVVMAAALVLFGLFVRRQARLDSIARHQQAKPAPVAPLALFAAPGFAVGAAANVVFFAGIGPFFFIFLLTLQLGMGESALTAGLATVPFAALGAVSSKRSALFARRLGSRVLVLGCGLQVAGHLMLMATLQVADQPTPWALAPALAVAGFGMGLFVAPVTEIVLRHVPHELAGAASGLLATCQQVGGAVGLALLGTLYFHLLGARPGPAGFQHTLTDALWWEVAVFVLAAAMCLRLPSPRTAPVQPTTV